MKEESLGVRALIKHASENILYKVKSGDIFGKIAEMFDVTESEIISANDSALKPNNLSIGQGIVIPPSKRSFLHEVIPGDTLLSLAESHGVSLEDILAKNSDLNPDRLSIGQQVRIPYAKSLEEKRKAADERHIRKWSGSEDELLAMTLLGEGGTFLDTGEKTMKEVLTVILNRKKYSGGTIKDIVFAPGQFEFWMKYDPEDIYSGKEWGIGHPRWEKALSIARSGSVDPNVAYSTHYWNPRLSTPGWRRDILVVHTGKHVYGVLPDGSQLYRKVYKENRKAIKGLKKYTGS